MKDMQVKMLNIADITPYENNPRRNDDAVNYVAESIKQFGFKQPIVIDRNNVIVAGHTRYKAAKKLKKRKVPCIIADDLTDEQIKAYRLADNKVAELAEWDFELLDSELESILDIDMTDFGFEFDEQDDEDDDFAGDELEEKRNEQERVFNAYNMELFDEYATEGKYQMPVLQPCNYIPQRMIGFNYAKTSTDFDACIHFYLDDYQFERIWNIPQKYIPILSNFEAVMTPSFSIYYDMAEALKIYNVFRSRLLGQVLQNAGMKVIPIVYWSDERSFDYCFDGLPENSTLSINTIGNNMSNSWELWHAGVDELIKRKKPKTLLIYGNGLEVERDFGNINVIYFKNEITERMRKGR